MLFQLINSFVYIVNQTPVTCEDKTYVHQIDFIETLQIVSQWVFSSFFESNIWGNVIQNMVTGNQDFVFWFIKTNMPRCMPVSYTTSPSPRDGLLSRMPSSA